MSRASPRRAVALLALLAIGGWALHTARLGPLPVRGELPPDRLPQATGVVHVHTTLSDGGGTPEQVIAAAQAAQLDFVVITDHNNLDALPVAGWHQRLLVMVGSEVSTGSGHVLALGLSEDPAFRFSGDALDALDDIRLLGGHAFAAHPVSPREDFRWEDPLLPGDWGLELLNGDSDWREAGVARLAGAGLSYPFNPTRALLASLSRPDKALLLWDRLLERRAVAGIAGADAHRRLPLTRRWSLPLPSYQAAFRLARNHVLLARPFLPGDPDAARRVSDALAAGRGWIGLDALAPSDGFVFRFEGPDGERVEMGDTAPPGSGRVAHVGGALPEGARVRLYRDGRLIAQAAGGLSVGVAEPGVYRAEVGVEGWEVPWVISNPIYLLDEPTWRARVQRAAWPAETAPPAEGELLESFEPGTGFQPEFDASSWMDRSVVERGAGADGGAAARIAFRLGAAAPGHPYTWCALVERRERDLSGRSGLAFRVKGDGVYRFWVQVRDLNPASADEGLEWWFASVRTSLEWRDVALPFERLRSINPNSDGRLDLDAVRGIVFVIDAGAEQPGTAGNVWLDELRVY